MLSHFKHTTSPEASLSEKLNLENRGVYQANHTFYDDPFDFKTVRGTYFREYQLKLFEKDLFLF